MTTRNLGKLFDQSTCKKRFLYQFKITEIERTNLQDLAYIIKHDPDSVSYLSENKLTIVFDLLPKSWFTAEIIDKINHDFIQKNFYKYFSDIPLYIPLNFYKKPYDEYTLTHYEYPDYGRSGGWCSHDYPLNNAIIWDRKKFEKYTQLYPRYLSKIRLNHQSKITKLTKSYLEVDNYYQLELSGPILIRE